MKMALCFLLVASLFGIFAPTHYGSIIWFLGGFVYFVAFEIIEAIKAIPRGQSVNIHAKDFSVAACDRADCPVPHREAKGGGT